MRKDVLIELIQLIPLALIFYTDAALAGSCSAAKLCCQGRDSGCVIQKESPNAIIESPRDKPCYCDHACLKLADCCDDFKETCGVVDCTVSEWSEWSACNTGCGSGTQKRSRTVRISEKNGGKHCPRLDQIRSCRSFQSCHSGILRPRLHDRSVTVLSFLPGDDNDTDVGNGNEIPRASQSCVAFTVVRASRACKRISSTLAEGTRICVERHEDEEDDSEEGKGDRREGARGKLLVGIGRWKLSTSVDGGSAARTAMNSSCHGKWIGDSRLLIDCDDPSCGEAAKHLRISRRARRSVTDRDDLQDVEDDEDDREEEEEGKKDDLRRSDTPINMASSGGKTEILYLFDRPAEPVYVPKGEKHVAFDIPADYLPDQYRPAAVEIFGRFGETTETKIPVKQITLPDLSIPMQLGRREPFSLFIPAHRKIAARLIDIFMGMRTYEDFLSVAVYCRDRMNPNMFIYALSVAILHRPDTKDLPIPPLHEVFPDKYIDGGVFSRAREEANIAPAGQRIPIEIPRDYTASDLDEEHRVAYWREDIGVNLHHWHWHLVYPFEADVRIVNKDRRGELFYYMHQQIQSRYNIERLCNRLGRVQRLINWREPIPEGYFPKLDSLTASRSWPARPSGAILRDISRQADQLDFDIQDLERWRDRIFEAIHTGSIVNLNGERVPLTEKDGIDVLGNIMEASILSPNPNLYGDLHNLGHVVLSYVHDPDNRYLESFSIMGEPATAMRDPVFYRWHAFCDDVFQEHKNTLPEYNVQQLDFPGVEIADIRVTTPNQPPNNLYTFWNKSDIDLSRGLDFTPRGPILVRFTHLNHADFTYTIVANNRNNAPRRGTVRIFIAPREDERGLPFTFRQQKNLMIEMDKFTVDLRPGQNTIERRSTESSLTIPFERTFRNVDENRPIGGDTLEQFNFCGCGWPQHLLVPKGSKEGYPMELFIMISDYTVDEVKQDESSGCKDAASFCGLRDRKYPDARSMGYPFDRRPRAGVDTLAQFLTGNMAVTTISINFNDSVVARPRSGSIGNTLTFT
ncbi:hypothetical protein KPH14_002940 [Odynerus spinipes]|uniref:SMB domain-containing protein n=1 Tax=Odynerus spinipes TaxID=1348599 RepID=A0AAD9RXV4_9HYME|nr:hypothetical protein KPH14_002940 [Odynerus spinipes]